MGKGRVEDRAKNRTVEITASGQFASLHTKGNEDHIRKALRTAGYKPLGDGIYEKPNLIDLEEREATGAKCRATVKPSTKSGWVDVAYVVSIPMDGGIAQRMAGIHAEKDVMAQQDGVQITLAQTAAASERATRDDTFANYVGGMTTKAAHIACEILERMRTMAVHSAGDQIKIDRVLSFPDLAIDFAAMHVIVSESPLAET